MNTLDAGFYFVEHENVPMHIGSLAVFEGPAPSYSDVFDLFAARLPLLPRSRQVVRAMPMQVIRPYWTDDEHFELRYHLRHASVPPPGGPPQLRETASQLLAQRLDRARPLWEAWFLDGLEGGRWAVLWKVHHCMVDGVGGSGLMAALFDLSPRFSPPAPVPWEPRPGPSAADVIVGGALDTMIWPLRQLAGLPGLLRNRLPGTAEALRFGRGLTGSTRRLAVPAASSLNGSISPHRRWLWTSARLGTVKRIRQALDVTVNDVVLAVITAGFRDLLRARGELSDELVVRSLVPVSLRVAHDHTPVSNKISAILVNLPVADPDPVRRLEKLNRQMDDLKRTRQAAGPEFVTGILGFTAPALLALGSRAAFRMPQPLVQTVTTNIPGPGFPLYLLGRQMTEVYPYVPIGNKLRIGIAVYSYLDTFAFGITADHSAVPEPDLEVLTGGISCGLAELLDRAKPPGAAPSGAGTSASHT
jgi:WS/DGAT/MGAT family acyltransferase